MGKNSVQIRSNYVVCLFILSVICKVDSEIPSAQEQMKLSKHDLYKLKNKTLNHIKQFKSNIARQKIEDYWTKKMLNISEIKKIMENKTGEAHFRAQLTKDQVKDLEEFQQRELEFIQMESATTINAAWAYANRYTEKVTTQRTRGTRTTPYRVFFEEDCDYIATYCMKAYDTGILCARTMYYVYQSFDNYCLLDYVNCMERYELWQVVHMGECLEIKPLTEYITYPYDDDYFLDDYYVVEQA